MESLYRKILRLRGRLQKDSVWQVAQRPRLGFTVPYHNSANTD